MFILAGLIIFVLDCVAVFDCLKSDRDFGKKVIWIIFILLAPLIGMGIYYLIGKKK